MSAVIWAAESGLIPDWVIRFGIRHLLRERLQAERTKYQDSSLIATDNHLATMRNSPIALSTESANDQHYEVPVEFFKFVLGPYLKYSCGLWTNNVNSLAEAEAEMLRTTFARADIEDGMHVLDLGCGWGSFALWVAQNYPDSRVAAVSNSQSQRCYIESERERLGLLNLQVVTADMNAFSSDATFDRIISVEMFEHMRNYEELVSRITTWLRPQGALFVHLFCHQRYNYFFEDEDKSESNWMAQHFFTGGMMPSEDLLPRCRGALEMERQWRVSGLEYERTALAWLGNLDSNREQLEQVFFDAGSRDVRVDLERWRLFFLSCAELFGYSQGEEWYVAHYRFRKQSSAY